MTISGTLSDANISSMSNAKVDIDVGSADSWVAVESWGNSVTPTRGTVSTDVMTTLDASNHIGVGVIGSSTVRVVMVFTSIATDPFANLYGQVGSNVDIRWSPTGADGEQRFYTSSAFLTDCSPPGWDSSSSGPVKFEFEISAADILNEVISS